MKTKDKKKYYVLGKKKGIIHEDEIKAFALAKIEYISSKIS